jgi:hypothetical protein
VTTQNLTGLTVTGPSVLLGDTSHVPLTVKGKQGSTQQLGIFLDWAGNPIFSVPPYGGPATFGDNMRMFHPGSVYNHSLQLNYDGSVTLGQQVGTDANPVWQGGVTLYSGSADPNVTPPVHHKNDAAGAVTDRPLVDGDRYFRSDGNTYAYLGGTWVLR